MKLTVTLDDGSSDPVTYAVEAPVGTDWKTMLDMVEGVLRLRGHIEAPVIYSSGQGFRPGEIVWLKEAAEG